eukprot:1157393-Pelagomonas_calceolata.AAC.2
MRAHNKAKEPRKHKCASISSCYQSFHQEDATYPPALGMSAADLNDHFQKAAKDSERQANASGQTTLAYSSVIEGAAAAWDSASRPESWPRQACGCCEYPH